MNHRTVKYAYTAYPTARQARWFAGAFGAMRVAYNDYLWQRERVYAGEQAELVPLDRFGLVRSKLSKGFADAGLGQLAACVEQAAQRRGFRFQRVNPAYTSQACAVCGTIDGHKDLSVREWQCDCGALLDRDYNAAVNILLLAGGHSESLNGPGGRVRRLELASPAQSAVSAEGATSFVAHKPRRRRTRAKSLARRARLKSQTMV